MKAENIKLLDFLAQPKTLFKIPVYQRNYEWGKEQCQQLFEDLISSYNEAKNHFLGAIVYVPESGKNMLHISTIIDGQQRLTSCLLLLKALADSDIDKKEEIVENYLTNKYVELNNHLKLKPVDKDADSFNAIMKGKVDKYRNPSKMVENYRLFKKMISGSVLSPKKLFDAMAYVNIVYIQLDGGNSGENPQVIFESLNSTGVSLSASDLIRNFVLMKLGSDEQARLYREYWSKIDRLFPSKIFTEFIRHYLITKTNKLVNQAKVYDTYKRYYVDKRFSSEEALDELYRNAQFYDWLLNVSCPYDKLNRLINHINIMDKKVVYPYLLKLFEMQNQGVIQWEQVEEIFKVIDSFLFRRMVCDIPSNGINSTVVSLMDLGDPGNELSNLKKKLLSNNFPKDKIVKNSLVELPIYNKKSSWAKLVLVVLEEKQTKETINFYDAQVEHIMPQKLNNEWRFQIKNAENVNQKYGGTIGNLTLTKYNSEMSNKSFSDKKDFYIKSNVTLTREVGKHFDKWGKDEIMGRSAKLADELIDIYPRPQEEKINKEISGEHSINDEVNVTGQKPDKIIIQSQEYRLTTWSNALVTFLNYIWDNDSGAYQIIKNNKSLKRLFSSNLRNPKKLQNGELIETNYSAEAILALLGKMAEVCGIQDEVSYVIK